ncbi:lipopolysaccharide assembly protein LapA domain-containing protein [Thermosyntropha sp.]|uniref:lipopolysaccharide assembly protein LapA domain-containing protein n=1 Tax=Thermosyntropha sp. TaxID=2740820 RepID=UPI0025F01655|nr:lipopolysaccharide assembly protein LapA domain-containing protein [Thermosyntropha sp.]MBO8159944.1 DUF1049 domain-containing protein [Thermosyntropha sp.]
MQGYLIGALIFILAVAIFVFQNTATVTVHFLKWTSPEVSLAVVVLVAALAGAVITFLVDSFRQFKIARKIKELTLENRKLQKQIKSLNQQNSSSGINNDATEGNNAK